MPAGGVSSASYRWRRGFCAGARPTCRSPSRPAPRSNAMVSGWIGICRRAQAGALVLVAALLATMATAVAEDKGGAGSWLEVAVRELPQTIGAEGVVEAIRQT